MRTVALLSALIVIQFFFDYSANAQDQPLAQTAPPAAEDPNRATTPERAEVRGLEELEERLTARWEARIDQLETERQALDTLFTAATYLGVVVAAISVGLTFFVGKSVADVRKDARDAARLAVEQTFREKSGVAIELSAAAEQVSKTNERLHEIEGQLSGYVALRDVAHTASAFDPLAQYYSLRAEVQRRRYMTIRHLTGDDEVKIEDTTHAEEFRQRASVIFEKLLETVRRDLENGKNRVSGNDLFNAAASAAEADFDFVALELMEAAFTIDGGVRPEIEARLIRQRLTAARIIPDEAHASIAKVLERTTGFDIHLVASEAFNIGQNSASPVKLVEIISNSISDDLENISYVWLNGARLLFMGSSAQDWSRGKEWYCNGLDALANEVPTAQWYQSSMEAIGDILTSRPELFDVCQNVSLSEILGKSASPNQFASRFGRQLAAALIRIGKLQDFLASGEEADLML